jgi:hypothetical protein
MPLLRAGGGGTAPKVLGVVKRLANQHRANDLILVVDQAAVRLIVERDLSNRRDGQRINHASQ